MNKVYVLAPLVAMVIFAGIYWHYFGIREATLAETRRVEALARERKKTEQDAARTLAAEQAKVTVAKRNQEKAEKEKRDEAEKQAKLDLEQQRSTAAEQAWRLRPRIDRLRSELDTAKAGLARAEERSRELREEQLFLAEQVQRVEANQQAFLTLLEKLDAAERQRAATAPANRTAAAGKN